MIDKCTNRNHSYKFNRQINPLFHFHLYLYRKKLVRHKLIECQTFTQNVEGINTVGQLMHLPRFFALYKPRHMILMEKVIGILKSKPNCMAEYQEVKCHFEGGLQNTLSRLFKSSFFLRFVQTDTVCVTFQNFT